MRSSLLVVLVLGCGSAAHPTSHVRMTAREIVDASSPAIVRVEVGGEGGNSRIGTGFIVGPSGLIATNLHVIEGEAQISVKLYKDEAAYPVVSIAGVDTEHDLALMWIQPPHKTLPTVRLGDSNIMSAGDKIYAIGNPLGFNYSVSDGLVSQVRDLAKNLTVLQISAPISQGSSGGPLFNQFGEVVGITTLIVTGEGISSDRAQNINLALPSNYLTPMIAKPQTIALADFAKQTHELAVQQGEAPAPKAGNDEDSIEIQRVVPKHALGVLDGCSQQDIEELITSIAQAIENGAPIYNTKTKEGYEACYRIYEGTALRYEKDAACKGVRTAFGDGLLRASALTSYKEKAWAMRDTFDGLIVVSSQWAKVKHVKLAAPIDQ